MRAPGAKTEHRCARQAFASSPRRYEVGEKAAVIENGGEVATKRSFNHCDEAPYTAAMSAPDAQTAAKTYCDRGNGGGSPSTLTTSTTEINCGRRSRSSMTKAPQTDRVGEIVVGPWMLRMVDQIAAASRRTPPRLHS